MKFSIVYLTFRPGGFDMLADSLRNQTVQDYELIIVDDYVVDRRSVVKRYLEDNGVKVGYIGKSKRKCFHSAPFNFVNALNTGVLASTCDVILFIQDYSWLPPDALERWMRHEALFEGGYCIAGAGKYWREEPEGVEKDFSHPTSLWREDWRGSPEDNGWMRNLLWIGCPFELFYSAIPYKVFVETNGFQEWNDYVKNCFLLVESFGAEVENAGFKILSDNNIVCEMINHKLWEPESLWHGLAETYNVKRMVPYTYAPEDVKRAFAEITKNLGLKEVSDWWSATYKDGKNYVTPTDFLERTMGNCFDLKKHVRGNIYWE